MDASASFERLMQEGRIALDKGDRDMAHYLWRRAAVLNPYSEQVWLALLDVLESREDQQVCLHNIVEINPLNAQARRLLRAYEAKDSRRFRLQRRRKHELQVLKKRQRSLMMRSVLLGVLLGVSGLFFAVVLSILIYGT
ncbi:MAG: hypothetical protein K8J31_04410 [Anaerolineae bacterium]|jgi:hypothetical protein|nr:hypothetical protein [Anaerolineae bacterium]